MKLYAYTFPSYKNKSWIKIGDTSRTVKKRVYEQFGTSNPEEPIILKEWDIKNYRDYDVHKILKSMNLIRINKNREWFECTVNDVSAAVNKLLNGVSRPNNFKMRDEQAEAVEKAYNYFRYKGDRFLWNAKMRFGKTFAAYQLMKRLNAKKTLILTYKPAIVDSWEDDLNNHIDFVDYKFNKALDYSKNDPIVLDEGKNVLFASFQDILGKDLNGEIKDKWLKIADQKYDLLIIDEVHFGANSYRAQKFLSSLKADKVLAMSGTPIKILMRGLYTEDEIYSWSYIDEQKKRNLEKENNWSTEIYRWLPKMHMHTYKLDEMTVLDSSFYSEEEGLTLNKFFGSDDGETLINDGPVQIWLDNLAIVSRKKFYSPFMVTKLYHMYWYLSSVNNVKVLAKKLRSHPFFKKYKIIIAADDNEGMGYDTLNMVKDEINKVEHGFYEGKIGTITLSCGKLNTGVSVPEWTSVWMLSDTSAVETYFQTIFRSQTPWKEGKKENCYIFDFNPNRALEMIYDYNEVIAKKNQSTPDSIREFLDCFEVLSYSNNEFKEIETEKIVEIGVDPKINIKGFSSEKLIRHINNFEDIINALKDIEKTSIIKKIIEVSESSIKNGKTFNIKLNSQKTKKEKDTFSDLKAKVITIMKCIPTFLFDMHSTINSVHDIINTSELEVFFDDTRITINIFKLMVDRKLINTKMLNRAIEAFNLRYDKSIIENRLMKLSSLNSPSNKEVYTPLELVNEILDHLPKEVWNNKDYKWFNPAVKNGVWLGAITIRLKKNYLEKGIFKNEKEALNWILKNQIYGYTVSKGALRTANELLYGDFKYKGNIEYKNALEEQIDMKFDVIVGNPPYQHPKGMGGKSLWKSFLLKFIDKYNNIMTFVVPSTWVSDKKIVVKLNDVLYYCSFNNISKRYFNMGVDISYIILNNKSTKHIIETNKEVFKIDSLINLPTRDLNSITIDILKKFHKKQLLSVIHRNIKGRTKDKSKIKNEKYKYPAFYTKAQPIVYTKEPMHLKFKKVIFSDCGSFEPFYDDGEIGIIDHGCGIIVNNKKEGINLTNYLNSKLVIFINKITRVGGFSSFHYKIPKIDLSKSWTDQELYKYFNLTQEEIDYIEKNV